MEKVKHTDSSELKSLFPEELIRRLLSTTIQNRKSIAIWSRPESQSFEIAIDLSDRIDQLKSINLEHLKSGFLIAPYNFPVNNASFIKADLYWDGFQKTLFDRIKSDKSDDFINQLKNDSNNSFDYSPFIKNTKYITTNREQYLSITNKAIEEINLNPEHQKVVLSRSKNIKTDAIHRLHNLFIDAIQKYPYSFNYLIYTPENGLWFGATPEVLFSHDENNIFETMALAGTQAYNGGSLKEASWTQKEIEEQALVSRYIINCFKKIRLREFEEHGPKTSMAGNLMHLRTDFNVDLNKIHFPELPNVMLELLHPTSAVCGMPKQWSQSFIKRNETHERELYSGFLGPINFDLGSSAYVNLRCCQIFNEEAILYAGAGITSDSIPEKEFLETEMKFNTIENLIK